MIRFRVPAGRLLVILMILVLASLAGCSSNKVRPGTTAAERAQYDMILIAYKDSQFKLDGGVLAMPDLEGHFAYLASTGQMPVTVLLRDGPETSVGSSQLREFARLEARYGFTGYVQHDGETKTLQADAGQ